MAKRKAGEANGRIDAHVYLDPPVLEAIRRSAEANARSISSEMRLTLTRVYVGRYALVPQ